MQKEELLQAMAESEKGNDEMTSSSELTREHVVNILDCRMSGGDFYKEQLMAHDATLRATITQQAQELEGVKREIVAWKEKSDAIVGTAQELRQQLSDSQARCREMEEKYVHQDLLLDEQDKVAQLQATLAAREADIAILRINEESYGRVTRKLIAERNAAVQEAGRLKEACAKIAERNTYMSPNADDGGNHGGPGSCEYGCGDVIAKAIRELK